MLEVFFRRTERIWVSCSGAWLISMDPTSDTGRGFAGLTSLGRRRGLYMLKGRCSALGERLWNELGGRLSLGSDIIESEELARNLRSPLP